MYKRATPAAANPASRVPDFIDGSAEVVSRSRESLELVGVLPGRGGSLAKSFAVVGAVFADDGGVGDAELDRVGVSSVL